MILKLNNALVFDSPLPQDTGYLYKKKQDCIMLTFHSGVFPALAKYLYPGRTISPLASAYLDYFPKTNTHANIDVGYIEAGERKEETIENIAITFTPAEKKKILKQYEVFVARGY